MAYNGFTNRETWLINLWFNPETKNDVMNAAQIFEDACDKLPDFLKDFVNTNINWDELLDQCEGDENE
jgi:hypothetical protein